MFAPKANSLAAAVLVALGVFSHAGPIAAQEPAKRPRVDGRGDLLLSARWPGSARARQRHI